jgi:hypothetical protein
MQLNYNDYQSIFHSVLPSVAAPAFEGIGEEKSIVLVREDLGVGPHENTFQFPLNFVSHMNVLLFQKRNLQAPQVVFDAIQNGRNIMPS